MSPAAHRALSIARFRRLSRRVRCAGPAPARAEDRPPLRDAQRALSSRRAAEFLRRHRVIRKMRGTMLTDFLFTHAASQPDALAIVDDSGRYTYSQLANMAAGLAL